MVNHLPDKFTEFSEARQNGFIKAKTVKDSGGKIAGIFCTFTPSEILDAAGIHSVSLCGMSDETIPAAEAHLPKNLCPLIKSSYGFAISEKCPYTYFADIIIGETTCDGKKKMYELLGKLKETYVLQLPQSIDSPQALASWKDELQRFRTYIEEHFNLHISDQALRQAAQRRNRLRAARSHLMELQKNDPPPLSGLTLYKTLEGAGFSFNIDQTIADLEELAKTAVQNHATTSSKVKRILVTGCPAGGVIEKIVGAIDNSGGTVVCFENCSGIKANRIHVDDQAPDIIGAIAEAYLEIGCSVFSPNPRRLQMLQELIEEFKVDGIIDVVLQACHTYNIETSSIRNLCKENGLPYLAIETDYSKSDSGQLTTRIAAFIEMMD